MKITFIKHSCYFVELEHCCLLFDWFEGSVPETDKPLYVFASHHHEDHFSPDVFRLCREGRETFFILSGDIFRSRIPENLLDRVVTVSPHQSYQIGELELSTLESTDMGVAFLLRCEGKNLYHAGDLNCWVWNGAPRVQNDAMRTQYRRELALLSGKTLDAAFVPLDPRQGRDFDQGMKYFLEAADAKHVFPMHMWGDFSVVPRFKGDPAYGEYADRLMDVQREGQEFTL